MGKIGVGVFQVSTDLPSGDPAVVAKHAEDLGFESYWAPEHTVIPVGSADVYPGKQDNEPPPAYLFNMPDPLIALTRASATTQKIRLGTGVSLIPERNPILTAKEVASLDHYSGGRFVFGIGAGWNEPECRVMGGDFEHRWTQVEEAMLAMKELWTKDEAEYDGKYFSFPPVICKPKPSSTPHPPILLGSIGSPFVLNRVVRWGNGWVPFSMDPKEIADGREKLNELAQNAGRNPSDIEVVSFSPTGFYRKASEVAELEKTGADTVVIWLDGQDEKELLSELDELASELL